MRMYSAFLLTILVFLHDDVLVHARRNLIVGVAFTYPPQTVRTTICSWAHHASRSSELFVYVGKDQLPDYNAFFNDPQHCRPASLHFRAIHAETWTISTLPAVNRYVDYLFFVKNETKDAAPQDNVFVMLMDMRDTVLQGNPFADAPYREMVFGIEDFSFGTEEYNDNWIRKGFSMDAWYKLIGKPISCSGVTIGPAYLMRMYLEGILSLINPSNSNIFGFDQGAHNYFYYFAAESLGVPIQAVPLQRDNEIIFTVGSANHLDTETRVAAVGAWSFGG